MIELYDIVGRKIATIFRGIASPGLNTIPYMSESLSSGIYFYRLRAGVYNETRKLVQIK